MKKILILLAFTCCCVQSVYAQMVLEFSIPTNPTIISLPLNGTVNVTVDWGDGSSENITVAGDAPHTYTATGTMTVSIIGKLTWFGNEYVNNANPNCLTRVTSWNNLGITSLSYAFNSANQLISVPISLPIGVTDLSGMFAYAYSFNQPIGSWNTANVTDMSHMFKGASSFNQPIGIWNTAKVTDMNFMFENASSFNQPIGTWNTSNVTDMSGMFWDASAFNQPLATWNTEAVTNMSEMFAGATPFNQPLAAWNTANVITMSRMFYVATSFNQPLGAWNTEAVRNMSEMFYYAISFNQPLGLWNTANVTHMYSMFDLAYSFNQPLDTWNTWNVTDMSEMFSNATSFNQPIGAWNTGNVTNMSFMFGGASSFDQPLDAWNTGNVTDMTAMFPSASSFNQPIGKWNITSVGNMRYMFTDDTLCTDNYDNLLNGWAAQTVKNNIDFDGGYSQYSAASSAARTNLINTYGWTITDGGLNPDNAKCFSKVTTGIQSNTVSPSVGVYPNPSTGQITISGTDALGTIIICNAVGAIVYQTNTNALQQNIDLSNNEPGLYLVKVGSLTSKLVKE